FGLEISSLPTKIHEQEKWIESESVRRLICLMKKWDIADDRVDLVRSAIFHVGFQPHEALAFSITSGFSHFKLRWSKGKRLPAKVYMAIKREA
ncbi:MAG: hypothetical protein K6F62_00535, partial [Schwartzia sp.]|nr:hypothetical protein [Schwartzia sp. (in: firmicutes)]